MRTAKFVLIVFLGACLVALGSPAFSAEGNGWVMEIVPDSEMSVSGSSTVHDWVCKDINVSGSVRVDDLPAGTLPELEDLKNHLVESPEAVEAEATIPVKQTHCEKEGMDPKTHKALKAEQHPNITYRMTRLKVDEPSSTAGDSVLLNTTGELTVAGRTRTVEMDVSVAKAEGQLVVSGKKDLKMTDFGIEKPTAMWGMIKAYDDVTVRFKVGIRPAAQDSPGGEGKER